MDDELALGESGTVTEARAIPLAVGGATVFVEQVGPGPTVESPDIYPVGPVSPTEAFEKANEALKECVRAVGDTVSSIAGAVRPEEVSLEFTITFQAEGTARIIPVLVTGKTGVTTGLKVTATWKLGE
jgi:Trypsin-co-occurring domain 1